MRQLGEAMSEGERDEQGRLLIRLGLPKGIDPKRAVCPSCGASADVKYGTTDDGRNTVVLWHRPTECGVRRHGAMVDRGDATGTDLDSVFRGGE